ncbi:MAG TPA: exosortase [Geobacteraceae bacterium]|nr:exosortase [Geobacteraceae bacterium]
MVALFVPTFYKLFTYGWKYADYSHGPLILPVFAWLIWRKREVLRRPVDERFNLPAFVLHLFGLSCYTIGSIFYSMVMESFAIIPVFLGVTGFLFGRVALRQLLFPAFFLIFLVPPPGFSIDMITQPLQMMVTAASAFVLKSSGYLISRDGVILHIGDYTIVVGEACSGLRSLVSLMAVGSVYAYLQDISNLRRGLLLLSIIPIAIVANIIRLIALAMITYHFGDAAGQGFFHEFSGLVLFVIALGCLVVVDVMLARRRSVS